MPLERTLVELPVQTGLQQKTDPRIVDVGVQTTLQNLVQDKQGAFSKRPGILDLGSLSQSPWGNTLAQASYSDARFLPTQPDGFAQVSGGRVWARGSSTTTAYDLDSVTNILADDFGIQVAEASLQAFDLCTNGINILVTWVTLNNSNVLQAWYAVFDASTYDVVQIPQLINTAGVASGSVQTVRCCSFSSTNAVIVAQVGGHLPTFLFTWSNFKLGAGVDITASFAGGTGARVGTTTNGGYTFYGNYDVSPVNGQARFAVAAGTVISAIPNLSVVIFDNTGFASPIAEADFQLTGGASAFRVQGVSLLSSAFSGLIYFAYALGETLVNHVFATQAPTNLAALSGTTALWTESLADAPEQLSIVADPANTAAQGVMVSGGLAGASVATSVYWISYNNAATTGVLGNRKGFVLASKLFTIGGLILGLYYYNAGNPSFNGATVLPTYYVCELQEGVAAPAPAHNSDLRYMATIAPRTANAGLYNTSGTLVCPNTLAISALKVLTMGSTVRNANTQQGLDLFSIYYSNALYQPAVMGDSTYLSGGVPCVFDGERVTNHGFPYQPPSISATIASSTGGLLASYTYTYAAVYEWRTKTGERKQSQPTITAYTSTSSLGIASIIVPSLNLSLEQDWEASYTPAVGLAIYRDTATTPGQLVRAWAADVPASMLNVFNTTPVYTDAASDASIAGNEQLYTTSNVLGAQCPPSFKCLIAHQGRLAGIGGDGLVWLTTKWDEGTTQPYFNDALTLAVGDLGRPAALSSMDGNLIVFKRDSIYLVGGDGPQNDGTGNTWQPQRVTCDVGCSTDWRSVVLFSQGVVFQNGSKLYLLSRGLETSYFSAAVEDLLAANPVIVGCANNTARNELRFVCKPSELATSSVVLNFNYVTQTWSSFLYYDTDAATFGADVDACIVQDGVWYHANFKGRVYEESATASSFDCGSQWPVGLRETGWLKAQGMQGFGRFWNVMVLETDFSPHDLTVAAAYNYGSLYADVASWTASQIASFTTNQPQFQLHLTQQKAESLRVKIFDGPPTGVASTTAQGANILGVTVEVGVKRGRFRIPEGQAL